MSDIVATVRMGALVDPGAWPGGQSFLVFAARNPIIRILQVFVHDLRTLSLASNYDVVIVRDRIVACVMALVLSRRVPVCYWMSFPFPEEDLLRSRGGGHGKAFRLVLCLRGRLSSWLLYNLVVPRVSHMFVQSERMAEAVKKKAGTVREMTVVPMGVDEEQLCNLPDPEPLPSLEGRFALAYLGALDRVRRIDFLLEVVFWLKPRWPEVALVLIGDSSTIGERRWLIDRIKQMSLVGDVIMTGQLPISEAWAHLRSARIGLSAIPRGEVFDVSSPTKVVEYLALGIPVVANDIPDQLHLLESTGAGICVPMNVEQFGRAVLAIAADHESYKQKATTCFDELIKVRGYEHLAEIVANVILQFPDS